MPTANQQLAVLFEEMANVMEILGQDSFRASAYHRAARAMAEMAQDVAAIGPDVKKLCELEGIGKGMAGRICEFLKTGKILERDELVAQIPPGLAQLLRIQGLGPKTIALLWKHAGVTSLEDLAAKIKSNALDGIKGLGAKKIENLRKSLEFAQSTGARVRIGRALPVAQWFVDRIREFSKSLPPKPGAESARPRGHALLQCEYAGSLRRGKETVGDVDIIVAADPADAPAISDKFVALGPVAQVLAKGPTKTSIRTHEGLQVDVRIVPPESFGAALLYFTGSKEHNVALRERAIKRAQKLNEYGLFTDVSGGTSERRVAGLTEEEVYKALGLAWIPPELREDRMEIGLAERGELPTLIELSDIKSELHAHTTASDGHWSIEELASAAAERGFHTIAVTDHSASQVIANGLTAERLEQHIVAVRAAAAKLKDKIRVLAGTEVDILADGKLDYPDSLLSQLDLVVASPHAALTQDPVKATKRLLRAIENRYVTILGHPTGRIVGRREGLSPDIGVIVKAAAQRGIALEINANSARLDLRDAHARAALDAGVMLAIDTDAHGPADLDQLLFGVLTARRAGATKDNVINCMSRETLASWLKKSRP